MEVPRPKIVRSGPSDDKLARRSAMKEAIGCVGKSSKRGKKSYCVVAVVGPRGFEIGCVGVGCVFEVDVRFRTANIGFSSLTVAGKARKLSQRLFLTL
ncbi:uncharacterized protein SPSK_03773 [Sporothrix schenckii 1099-18]|uniref:Uncharacterized protein n=1 Tax=Sporothrix schenckii 1099-18 TaxID=1397361 RepID=A0A0F2M0F0_SPOSC|nr:uncharacterized protein SPSK_03773 [Sporothrix schenckii 1099-18]KJR82549.1 hypothetical protein SPSK_03773 [Sporothrix schenckii 1099-18]